MTAMTWVALLSIACFTGTSSKCKELMPIRG